jgi:flagellar M-ring protein FliF
MQTQKPLRIIAIIALFWLLAPNQALAQEDVARDDPYASRKVFYEEHWQRKIDRVLHYIDGVVVSVNVELSPQVDKRVTAVEFKVPVPITENQKTIVAKNIPAAVRSGMPAQSAGQFSEGDAVTSQQQESETTYAVPKTQTVSTEVGLIPTDVYVCVAIPRSFVAAISSQGLDGQPKPISSALDRNAMRVVETDLANKIEDAVNVLLPRRKLGEDEYSRVEIHFFDDKVASNNDTTVAARHSALTSGLRYVSGR